MSWGERWYAGLIAFTLLCAFLVTRCPAQVKGGQPFHRTPPTPRGVAITEVRPASEVTVRIEPLSIYATWWKNTEDCMGLHGNFDKWSWYSVQEDAFTVDGLDGGYFLAYTFGPFDPIAKPGYWWRIYVVNAHLQDAPTIRHEMLHALANLNGMASLHHTQEGDSLFAVFAARSFCRP
jgi:hypothetical protein